VRFSLSEEKNATRSTAVSHQLHTSDLAGALSAFDLQGRNWNALVIDQNSAGRPDVPLVQGEQVLSGGGGRVLDGAVRVFQRAELVLALHVPNDKIPIGRY